VVTAGLANVNSLAVNNNASIGGALTMSNLITTSSGGVAGAPGVYPAVNNQQTLGAPSLAYQNAYTYAITLPGASGSGSHAMTQYEDVPGTPQTFTGPATLSNVLISLARVGNIVCMRIAAAAGSASAATQFQTSFTVPAELRPIGGVQCATSVYTNSATTLGTCQISPSGVIGIAVGSNAPFSPTGIAGWPTDICATWSVLT
jgi:hypothetical protein